MGRVVRDLVLRDPAMRVLAPEFLDPRVAIASIAVEIVTQRIFLVIFLMVAAVRVGQDCGGCGKQQQ